MKNFKANKISNERIKWIIYILLDLIAIISILKFSKWHFISKTIFLVSLLINLSFDFYYLKKFWKILTNVIFDIDNLILIDSKNEKTEIKYSDLKYSIRKKKFEKDRTEIEIKTKSKTTQRLHIKNWNKLLEIEEQLELKKIERVKWKAKTLWGKYWGIFIDLIFLIIGADTLSLSIHQEEKNRENTLNPIENEK